MMMVEMNTPDNTKHCYQLVVKFSVTHTTFMIIIGPINNWARSATFLWMPHLDNCKEIRPELSSLDIHYGCVAWCSCGTLNNESEGVTDCFAYS